MYLEFHLLQNTAPSNLNRDDAGQPKACTFGYYDRARISSQCFKRAIRTSKFFKEATHASNGERTEYLIGWLTEILAEKYPDFQKPAEEFEQTLSIFVECFAGGLDEKEPNQTSVLVYLSPDEVITIVDELVKNWDDALVFPRPQDKNARRRHPVVKALKEIVDKQKKRNEYGVDVPDIALFGRMLAERPEIELNAACQVAHAISTHEVRTEIDYFTAMDDRQPLDEPGAAHINAAFFNSACFYRYAQLDWDELVKNLRGDKEVARRTVDGFLRGLIFALPKGKQSSFNSQTYPNLVLVVIRDDGFPWSMVNAFETPVQPKKEGLIAASFEALDNCWGYYRDKFGVLTSFKAILALPLHPTISLHPKSDHNLSQYVVKDLPTLFEKVQSVLQQEARAI
ncbi:MAG: type I-E CRISPR-associated protein Cas7/Cse4/CasC [Chloroflexota bacterium]|nr:MAG: type I-E CRISPR-associated protein Cas7/Cse4/CasC [Chloroflexota bacterium]